MSRMTGAEKHSVSATSTLDVLWTLYDRVLKVDPADPLNEVRDRFILSKGHGPMAFYAVLAAKGFLPVEVLQTFGEYDSPLGHHPDRSLLDGVEIASGSLGHGLPVAVGICQALRAKGNDRSRVVVLVGDAELDEGSNHEAIALAGRWELEQLSVVAIDNQSSSYGWPGGLEERFRVEGWNAERVDGRDHDEVERALSNPGNGRPSAIIAHVERKAG